jgi:S1-C subfamily serine protease
VSATLDELEQRSDSRRATQGGDSEGGSFGLQVEPLTKDRARELGISAESGVLIRGVSPESPASRAGLQPGDVIETVDGKGVTTADELQSALRGSSDRPALLLIHRKDQSLFVTLKRS